jgi:hypothetical protein
MNTGLENLGPEAMPKVAGGFFQLWNERFRGSASVELRIYSCIFPTLDEFQNFSSVCCYQFQVFTLDLMFLSASSASFPSLDAEARKTPH